MGILMDKNVRNFLAACLLVAVGYGAGVLFSYNPSSRPVSAREERADNVERLRFRPEERRTSDYFPRAFSSGYSRGDVVEHNSLTKRLDDNNERVKDIEKIVIEMSKQIDELKTTQSDFLKKVPSELQKHYEDIEALKESIRAQEEALSVQYGLFNQYMQGNIQNAIPTPEVAPNPDLVK